VIVLVGSALLYRVVRGWSEGQAIQSLAVLPLENLSGDPAQEYLADGMTEEVIGRLAGLRGRLHQSLSGPARL
jgi:hypothetical protein